MAAAGAGDPAPPVGESVAEESNRQRRSTLRWMWSGVRLFIGLFRRAEDSKDFEKRLQYLSKEELSVRARLRKRTAGWRKMARTLILSSVVLELLAIGVAVFWTRGPPLSWQERAFRVGPVFLLPLLSTLVYSACSRIMRHWDSKDTDRLQKLTLERQNKIEELKEKTQYYKMQQLIQRYDTDPTAKAAAAQVLVSKLGSEAGLKVQTLREDSAVPGSVMGPETGGTIAGGAVPADPLAKQSSNGRLPNAASGEFEPGMSAGTMRRRTVRGESGAEPRMHGVQFIAPDAGVSGSLEEALLEGGEEGMDGDQGADSRHGGGSRRRVSDSGGMGWLGRLAALLVGEDPTQCYALICENCRAHNGLVPKEDYQVITYFCPHCKHLNGGKKLREGGSSDNLQNLQVPMTSPNTPRISLMGALDGISADDDPHRRPSGTPPAAAAGEQDFSFAGRAQSPEKTYT